MFHHIRTKVLPEVTVGKTWQVAIPNSPQALAFVARTRHFAENGHRTEGMSYGVHPRLLAARVEWVNRRNPFVDVLQG